MADVFISYKHRMRSRVDEIAGALKALGLDVWYDEGLISGDDYAGAISKQLRAARCVVVVWTPDVFPPLDRHGWVRGEAQKGRDRDVLVAIMLEPTDLDPPWNTVQYENLVEWTPHTDDRTNWRRTLRAIGGLVGRPGLAELDRAWAAGTASALAAWAREFPDDPLAQRLRSGDFAADHNEPVAKQTPPPRPITAPPRTTVSVNATVAPARADTAGGTRRNGTLLRDIALASAIPGILTLALSLVFSQSGEVWSIESNLLYDIGFSLAASVGLAVVLQVHGRLSVAAALAYMGLNIVLLVGCQAIFNQIPAEWYGPVGVSLPVESIVVASSFMGASLLYSLLARFEAIPRSPRDFLIVAAAITVVALGADLLSVPLSFGGSYGYLWASAAWQIAFGIGLIFLVRQRRPVVAA